MASIFAPKAGLGATLAVSLLTAGCVSVLPEPAAPSAHIALPMENAVAPPTPLRADIGVYPPDAPRAFAGIDIAVRERGEIVFMSDLRWADAPPRLMQAAVLDALAKAPGEGRAASVQLGARVDYEIRWRIADLSAGRGRDDARVVAEASLVNARTGRIIAQQEIRSDVTPLGGSARARATALASAAQDVANRVAAFATDVAEPVPGGPGR
jgi:ABC-type uncharacterized transport system auxiliary subunit